MEDETPRIPRSPNTGRERSTSPKWDGDRHPPEYYRNRIAKAAAESGRRSHLTRAQRATEDGARLRRSLNLDPTQKLLLQPSPPSYMSRAECSASLCTKKNRRRRVPRTITDQYRVFLDGSVFREYYHVSCLENVLDLASLAPAQLDLDDKAYRWNHQSRWKWSFMLQKWVEHKGCIDLDRIAAHFRELDAYDEAHTEMSAKHIKWQLAHTSCRTDRGSCNCPPEPTGWPKRPVLQDYITDEARRCRLSDIIEHPYCDRRIEA